MSTYVCEEHGDDIVVYRGSRGVECPFCKAETEIDDLKQAVEDLEGERDSLQAEVDAISPAGD